MAKEAKKPAADKAPKEADKVAPSAVKEVVTVKAGALSVDVGPAVIAGMSKAYEDEQKANTILASVESRKYDMMSQLTAAIVKAAKADESIDLSATLSGDPKKMNKLNDQLGLALGFREVTVLPATDKVAEIRRIGPAKAVQKYFPGPKDDKNSPEYARKNTIRSNFLHQLKKCAQAANGLIVTNTTYVRDEKSGTLQISGPAVEKAFGQKTVLLNEKQTMGEGDAKVQLTQKPSFTAVAKLGAAAAGKVLEQRAQTGISGNAISAGAALQGLCKSLTEACSKLKLPADDETKRALSIAQAAIDTVLKGSQPAAPAEKEAAKV